MLSICWGASLRLLLHSGSSKLGLRMSLVKQWAHCAMIRVGSTCPMNLRHSTLIMASRDSTLSQTSTEWCCWESRQDNGRRCDLHAVWVWDASFIPGWSTVLPYSCEQKIQHCCTQGDFPSWGIYWSQAWSLLSLHLGLQGLEVLQPWEQGVSFQRVQTLMSAFWCLKSTQFLICHPLCYYPSVRCQSFASEARAIVGWSAPLGCARASLQRRSPLFSHLGTWCVLHSSTSVHIHCSLSIVPFLIVSCLVVSSAFVCVCLETHHCPCSVYNLQVEQNNSLVSFPHLQMSSLAFPSLNLVSFPHLQSPWCSVTQRPFQRRHSTSICEFDLSKPLPLSRSNTVTLLQPSKDIHKVYK